MKTLSVKNLKKMTRTVCAFNGGAGQFGETTTSNTTTSGDTTTTTVSITTTTHFK